MTRRFGGGTGSPLQELLGLAVLEGMKRHHRQPSTLIQQHFGGIEATFQFTQFVIDENA